MNRRAWLLHLVALVVVAGLPVMARWSRQQAGDRCALDGRSIEPRFQVRIAATGAPVRRFCCIRCAEAWLSHQDRRPAAVLVTDEESGQELDAAGAFFVRSTVVSNASTGNRIHVFKDLDAAEAHRALAGGTMLRGPERPFWTGGSTQPASQRPRLGGASAP
jgi:hypothetical protein